jgi:trimethylamine--corrinoid protein Co-methyltransferase
VTLAGAMALGIAENLVGLTIHQLTNRGAPFLFAPNVSVLDMRHTVISYGCTEWSLTQAALADMRDMIYHLPIWSFAGATDAKTVDAQAGAEGMLSIITAMLSRCNFIHDVGYIESGHTSSLEMLTMADELVAMSRYFVDGLRVDDDTLALDVIDRVARNGSSGAIFISDSHTFDHFKTALFHPVLTAPAFPPAAGILLAVDPAGDDVGGTAHSRGHPDGRRGAVQGTGATFHAAVLVQ